MGAADYRPKVQEAPPVRKIAANRDYETSESARLALLAAVASDFLTHTEPEEYEDVALKKAVTDQVALATERFLMVRELKTNNEALQEANADLRQFAYTMSHDLQKPVRTIALYAELLKRGVSKTLTEREQHINFVVGGATVTPP
jgi:light-regulated signal transduction histidine kinase (bacteriophytochrome)